MPLRAPRLCRCGKIVPFGHFCECQIKAARERKARADANRLPASARGYDSKWRRERDAFLARPENRLCACGCGRVADVVDHIIPHGGDRKLFWDRKNWQPLAASPCHASKKQREERAAKTNG
ncbi:MAG: HNH endonuclease [Bauldia sp.]|nr:HNH endonuclease [Bauldia sp.]